MGSESQTRVRWLLPELAEMKIGGDVKSCLDRLIEFTKLAVCPITETRNHQDPVIYEIKSLIRAVLSQGSKSTAPVSPELHTVTLQRLEVSIEAVERYSNVFRENLVAMQLPVVTSSFTITEWPYRPNQRLYSLPHYLPYHHPEPHPRSLIQRLEEQAMKPLHTENPNRHTSAFHEPNELTDGYIYVYWNRISFGLVKIGFTSRDVGLRLQEWANDCGHRIQEFYRSPSKIKHAARVEKLIHTEFRDQRVFQSYCDGCRRTHTEWFKGLDVRVVIERIEAWTEWIMKEPYVERSNGWRLRQGGEFHLPRICATAMATGEPDKKEVTVKKEVGRYNLRRRRV